MNSVTEHAEEKDKRSEFNAVRKKIYREFGKKNLVCARCGCACRSIHLHHIEELHSSANNEYENLIPLCFNCHGDWDLYMATHISFEDFLVSVPNYYVPALFKTIKEVPDAKASDIVDICRKMTLEFNRLEWIYKSGMDDDNEYYQHILEQNKAFCRFNYAKTLMVPGVE